MNIRNPEVERLAKELAALTGSSRTEAIRVALAEKLERMRESDSAEERRRRALEIIERLPPAPPGFTSDDSDLYDDEGLPA